jgi:hypothetical protein
MADTLAKAEKKPTRVDFLQQQIDLLQREVRGVMDLYADHQREDTISYYARAYRLSEYMVRRFKDPYDAREIREFLDEERFKAGVSGAFISALVVGAINALWYLL